MYPITNARWQDIVKACKNHYGNGGRSYQLLEAVVKFHNGMDSISKYDVFSVIVADTCKFVELNSDFMHTLIHDIKFNDLWAKPSKLYGDKSHETLDVLFENYVNRVTMTKREKYPDGLPENCPYLVKYIAHSVDKS